MRLRKSDKAIQGLEEGYEEMHDKERKTTHVLKTKDVELADCREILRITADDLDDRTAELQAMKKEFSGLHQSIEGAQGLCVRRRSKTIARKQHSLPAQH